MAAEARKDNPAKSVKKPEKPAEALIKELFAGLAAEQKKAVVHTWDDKRRLGMYNAPIGAKIGKVYTQAQRDLLAQILRAIASDEDGYRQLTRNGTFDGSHAFENCGADIFGEPGGGNKYAWLFTGHHLTVRCDGDSEEGAAFGGPMYYGHSPNGYSDRNIFNYQTKSVVSVYDALSEKQRKVAVVTGTPGERTPSVKFRPARETKPGISYGELNKDQQGLVEKVMRDGPVAVPQGGRRRGHAHHQEQWRPGENSPGLLPGPAPGTRSTGTSGAWKGRLRVELPRAAARPHLRQHLQQAHLSRRLDKGGEKEAVPRGHRLLCAARGLGARPSLAAQRPEKIKPLPPFVDSPGGRCYVYPRQRTD